MDFVFVSLRTNTGIMVLLCSLTGSTRYCILLQYPRRSCYRAVIVALSTRYFDSTGYPMNACPTETLGPRRSFGNPFSNRSGRVCGCQHLTILQKSGQTERANRVLEEILRGCVHPFSSWSEFLPMVKFAIMIYVHALTQHTPVFVGGVSRPRLPTLFKGNSWI